MYPVPLDWSILWFCAPDRLAKDSDNVGNDEEAEADEEEYDEEEEEEEEEDEGMETYWSFIVGMLTNLGALPVPRYASHSIMPS